MDRETQMEIKFLRDITEDPELLEVARFEIQRVLLEFRDSRISQMRNNGLVIKEKDGEDSHVIRLGPEDALRIGLKAIADHIEKKNA